MDDLGAWPQLLRKNVSLIKVDLNFVPTAICQRNVENQTNPDPYYMDEKGCFLMTHDGFADWIANQTIPMPRQFYSSLDLLNFLNSTEMATHFQVQTLCASANYQLILSKTEPKSKNLRLAYIQRAPSPLFSRSSRRSKKMG